MYQWQTSLQLHERGKNFIKCVQSAWWHPHEIRVKQEGGADEWSRLLSVTWPNHIRPQTVLGSARPSWSRVHRAAGPPSEWWAQPAPGRRPPSRPAPPQQLCGPDEKMSWLQKERGGQLFRGQEGERFLNILSDIACSSGRCQKFHKVLENTVLNKPTLTRKKGEPGWWEGSRRQKAHCLNVWCHLIFQVCVKLEHWLLNHKAHLGQIILVVNESKIFPFLTAFSCG